MIQVENLVFQYPGNDGPTLKGLNFSIAKGEIFGFLGPSGAGKSTAQKVLYKILEGYKGQVNIDGKNLSEWNNSYFERIGVGFELPNHYLKLTGKKTWSCLLLFIQMVNKKTALNFLKWLICWMPWISRLRHIRKE
nr:ATP-binding cassette domain-containing protein [uncultured Draconibacterium sp.]